MKRAVGVTLCVAAFAGLVLLVLPPRQPTGTRTASEARGIIVRTYTVDGALSWEVAAHRGSLDGEDGRLEEPQVVFFDGERILFEAQAAELMIAPTQAELTGDVTAANHEGNYQLTTDVLRWSSEEEVLTAGTSTLMFDRGVIQGSSFTFVPSSQRAILDGEVHGTLELDPAATVRCARLEWESDGQFVLLDVEIEHGDRVYRAQHAATALDTETITLTGTAQVQLARAILTADHVRLDNDGIVAEGSVSVTLDDGFFEPGSDA